MWLLLFVMCSTVCCSCDAQVYAQAMAKPYKRDFRELIDAARVYYASLRRDRGDEIDYGESMFTYC